jgi:hypothetical protein
MAKKIPGDRARIIGETYLRQGESLGNGTHNMSGGTDFPVIRMFIGIGNRPVATMTVNADGSVSRSDETSR